MRRTILAGDVGGTKTWLGLFDAAPPRPVPLECARYSTPEFDGLGDMVARFLERARAGEPPAAACFGVAGPVRNETARLTNIPWAADARVLRDRFRVARVHLVNDVEAMGWAIPRLAADELTAVQTGTPGSRGNAALIAPGTGLGEAALHRVGPRLVPMPSEGGHADFAARTPREIDLLRALTGRFGRVSCEHVLSGPGLTRIHSCLHGREACPAADGSAAEELPRRITAAALERRCPRCVETLELFTGALGAEAGNLGLRALATAGVYVGGGIAPRILPLLASPVFLEAFRAKGPMQGLMTSMPVRVIRIADPALLGAAVAARELASASGG